MSLRTACTIAAGLIVGAVVSSLVPRWWGWIAIPVLSVTSAGLWIIEYRRKQVRR